MSVKLCLYINLVNFENIQHFFGSNVGLMKMQLQ